VTQNSLASRPNGTGSGDTWDVSAAVSSDWRNKLIIEDRIMPFKKKEKENTC